MTFPPGITGGIRGPLGSTLDTVVAAIDALTAAVSNPVNGLPGIAAELTALLLETRKLTGPAPLPGNWPGLPVYLNTVIGTSPAATEEGQSLYGINLEAKNALQLTQGGLFGAFPPTPAARVAELVTQATLAATRLGELREYLEALALVTGTVEAPPLGSTIKDLLRSIDVTQAALLECCEGGDSGTFVPTVPTSDCNGLTAVYTECTLELKFTNSEVSCYGVVWPDLTTQTDRRQLSAADTLFGAPAGSQFVLITLDADSFEGDTSTACVRWDFAPDEPWFGVTQTNNGDYQALVPFNTTVLDATEPKTGGLQVSWSAFNGTLNRPGGAAVNVLFPPGATPNGKVWVTSGNSIAS